MGKKNIKKYAQNHFESEHTRSPYADCQPPLEVVDVVVAQK